MVRIIFLRHRVIRVQVSVARQQDCPSNGVNTGVDAPSPVLGLRLRMGGGQHWRVGTKMRCNGKRLSERFGVIFRKEK